MYTESVLSDRVKQIILKRRAALKRQKQRKKYKLIAEKRFLSWRISKSTRGVLQQCPGIGKAIEAFVTDCNVGADAWCRTGILTFDGNRSRK